MDSETKLTGQVPFIATWVYYTISIMHFLLIPFEEK